MAEIAFTSIVRQRGIEKDWIIDSAGTAGYHIGDTPDDRTIEVTKKHFGKDFPSDVDFRARQIHVDDFEKFQYIFCMDHSNLKDLKKVQSKSKSPTAVLKMFGECDVGCSPEDLVIEDPYYGGMDGFRKNLSQVIRCTHGFLEMVKNK